MTEQSSSFFQRNKHWILPILILVIAVAVFALLRATKPVAPSRPVAEKVWNVRALPAEYVAARPQLTLYGRIESPASSTLSSSVTAHVEQRLVAEGEQVEQNDLLLQLDDRDARLLLTQREADVERIQALISAEKVRYQSDLKALKIERELVVITQRTLERYKDLSSRQVASKNQYDDALRTKQQQSLSLNSRQQSINDHPNRLAQLEAQLKQATALRDSAALDLERTQIRAPFPGRIASINVAAGDRVRSGDPLLNIYNTDALEVRAQIPSRFLPTVREQLNSQQMIDASAQLDGQPVQLQLERLAAAVDGGRAGIDALFRINSDYKGEPGRAISLELHLPPEQNVLALPPQAIFGTDRIYTVVDGRLAAQQVLKVGDALTEQGEPRILVRSNSVKSGEKILATQLPNAVSGLLVKVAE